MVEFKTLKSKEVKFGRNGFIEISKRKVSTPVGDNEFIAISRGYYMPDALPSEKEKRKKIADIIINFD